MKFNILITLITFAMSLEAYAQNKLEQLIDMPGNNMSIATIIKSIEKQSEFYFSYSNKIPLNENIEFTSKRLSINTILQRLEEARDIRHQIRGTKIILLLPAKKATISGFIRDAASGENLIGASIYTLPDLHGTTSNSFGFFSLTLPQDTVHLVLSYSGYQNTAMDFILTRDTMLYINQEAKTLAAVEITSDEYTPETTQMSAINISLQQMKTMPAFAGENDVMKALQLLPGVQSGSEGSSGLYVRGGGPDQNLILLDGVPVYNASHLFGFFSVFNADAINNVELIKGGFPARYGGRLSSVIDISMKEGNREKLKGEGSIGLISSKLTLEGPIKANKSSFIISARRTYIDLLVKPIMKGLNNGDGAGYYFYDFNTKLNYTFSKTSRVYLSTYTGKDKGFSENSGAYRDNHADLTRSYRYEAELKWGNITSALRWNYIVSPNLFANVAATYSRYGMSLYGEDDVKVSDSHGVRDESLSHFVKSGYRSSIQDYTLKADFDYTPSLNHFFRFGGYGIRHEFSPGASTLQSQDQALRFDSKNITAVEAGAYVEDDFVISKKLKVNAGIHFSQFSVEQNTFRTLQPRISARYLIRRDLSIKTSFARMAQYIHLLSNSGLGMPTDLWVPATSKIKPQLSEQIALGISYSPTGTYEFSIENYYKLMDGVLEYRDGASFLNTQDDWQSKVAVGDGLSYGSEFFLQKKQGKWTGWVGYTFSKTYRQFEDINGGKRFPYRYDRRHDIELNLNREISDRKTFSFVWVFGTGNATTVPTVTYGGWTRDNIYSYQSTTHYKSRNNFRMRAYHRLDLSFTWRKPKRWGERAWVLGIYNAYSRQNPFYVDISYDYKSGKRKLYQYGLFPIIPSFSYQFKF